MMKYGLLGKHLSHSFSQRFFESYFKQHKIDASYELIELSSPDALKDFMLGSVAQYQGLNVTIPFKEHILEFIDEVSSEAQIIGAINTIKVGSNGKICGYNTDAFGFHQSIKPFLDFNHHRAIILGTGGASKAVAFVLEKLGLDVFFISRNPEGSKQFSYSEINAQMLSTCKLVINCTPVGMFPNSDNLIDIPYEFLTKKHLIIDLIYNPSETVFLKKSRESGATVLNGDSMLHQQALKSWELWNQ